MREMKTGEKNKPAKIKKPDNRTILKNNLK